MATTEPRESNQSDSWRKRESSTSLNTEGKRRKRPWTIVVIFLTTILLCCLQILWLQPQRHFLQSEVHLEHSSLPGASKNSTAVTTIVPQQQDSPKTEETVSLVNNYTNNTKGGSADQPSSSTATLASINATELHSTHIPILDLQDWEIESLEGILDPTLTIDEAAQSCRPPRGIDKKCCIGTFSAGGDIVHDARAPGCSNRTIADYHAVRDSIQIQSNDCDLCRVVELARDYNLTVAFWGDSMTNQVVQGLVCELQRRNYVVTAQRTAGRNRNCKRCIKWTSTITIESPAFQTVVVFKFLFQYKYPFWYPEEEYQVATSGDVLVLGIGLHWGYTAKQYESTRQHYKRSYVKFLEFLHANSTVRLLAHRETSAQHFDADGGEYSLRNESSLPKCVPMSWGGTAGWRETMVIEAARAAHYRITHVTESMKPKKKLPARMHGRLYILPWFNFTAQHHQMHPRFIENGQERGECSHYCSSPFLYIPIWRSLRLAMEREFVE